MDTPRTDLDHLGNGQSRCRRCGAIIVHFGVRVEDLACTACIKKIYREVQAEGEPR